MIRLIFRGASQVVTEQFAEQVTERLRAALEKSSPHAPGEATLHAEREDYAPLHAEREDYKEKSESSIRVLGPAAAPIAKLRGKHRFHTMLFGQDGDLLRAAVREATTGLEPPDDVQWVADVDPLEMM